MEILGDHLETTFQTSWGHLRRGLNLLEADSHHIFFLHKAHQDSRIPRSSEQPVLGRTVLTCNGVFFPLWYKFSQCAKFKLSTEHRIGKRCTSISACRPHELAPAYHSSRICVTSWCLQEQSPKQAVGLWGEAKNELGVGFLCQFVFYWLQPWVQLLAVDFPIVRGASLCLRAASCTLLPLALKEILALPRSTGSCRPQLETWLFCLSAVRSHPGYVIILLGWLCRWFDSLLHCMG